MSSRTLAGGDEKLAKQEPDGSCDMHLGNLLTGLALSIVERKKGGKVINYWPPFQLLLKKSKNMAKYVCDKKNKRFEYIVRFLERMGRVIKVINIPCLTRVCGVWLLIQDCLSNMHALRLYAMEVDNFFIWS